MNIVREIFARHRGSGLAVIDAERTVSFRDLEARVRGVSAGLKRHVLWPACAIPRVALRHPGGVDYIVTALAILDAGGCFLPVPDELTAPERSALLRSTGADLILEQVGNGKPELRTVVHEAQPAFPVPELEALNPAFIRFSSGTTGRAKGIVLSHESLRARITAANEVLQMGPGDRVLWMLPMAHHFAVSIVLYLYHGATTVLSAPGGAVPDCEPTVIYGSPYHYAMLASDPDTAGFAQLRLAVSTAFALPESTASHFRERFGIPLWQAMGIIEAGLPLINDRAADGKPTSIGRPIPSFEAKLTACGNGAGELMVRGPGMLDAILSPWQLRADILHDGWLATGDVAERDPDGDWFLRGRTRSVINVGGLKCFPEEIEEVLRMHPGVAGARVSGRPHPGLGTVPVAEIVGVPGYPVPSGPELRAHCRRMLAPYKIPLSFRPVASLPVTASGKIRRVLPDGSDPD